MHSLNLQIKMIRPLSVWNTWCFNHLSMTISLTSNERLSENKLAIELSECNRHEKMVNM